MRFASIVTTSLLLGAASSVRASTSTSTSNDNDGSLERREAPYYGQPGIVSPAPGTKLVPGQEFLFTYRTSAFSPRWSKQIWVGFETGNTAPGAARLNLLAFSYKPEVADSGFYNRTFVFDPKQFGTGQLTVWESVFSVRTPLGFTTTSIPLTK